MPKPLTTCLCRVISCPILAATLGFSSFAAAQAAYEPPDRGTASWYGEQHRGKLMANGKPFNPDKLTAASWFYPLGTRVRVTLLGDEPRSVVVTITDRGPARRLVDQGRIIDLGRAAFRRLGSPDLGLVPVRVEVIGRKAMSNRNAVQLAKKAHQQDAPKLHTVKSM